MTPLASKLLQAIERDMVGRPTFTLPPARVAAALPGAGWHGASDAITELARAGHIVAVAVNVRRNIVWQLSANPQPCSDPPRERFVGRGMTSRRDKCETVLAFLRSRYCVGEPFSIRQTKLKSDLRTTGKTVGDALHDLVANGALVVVAPFRYKIATVYKLTGRELPTTESFVVTRRASLGARADMYAVGSQSNKSAGSAPRAEME
jgi:hypothetical protein